MKRDGFEMGFVRVHGHRIFYRSRGEPKKGCILALHGGPGGSHIGMLAFADLAQHGYRVVFFDHLGCGRSQRPRSSAHYTIESRADEAERIRRALDLGRVHLIGHSFGASTALEVAVRYPRTLQSLTVVSGVTNFQEYREDTWRHLRDGPRSIRETIEKFEERGDLESSRYREALESYWSLPMRTSEGKPIGLPGARVHPWELVESSARYNWRVDRMFVGKAADRLTAPIEGSTAGWDISARLTKIRTPTLVAVGRHDSVDIRFSRRIHRAIRGSKLVVFEQSGHSAFMEERDLFMSTELDFLNRHVRGRRGES